MSWKDFYLLFNAYLDTIVFLSCRTWFKYSYLLVKISCMLIIYFDQIHLSHSLQFVPDPPLHHPPNFMFSFYVPLSPISVGFKCMGVGPLAGATYLGSHPPWKLILMSLAVGSCQMLLSWGWGLMCPFRSILECWLVSCAGNGDACELRWSGLAICRSHYFV